MRLILPFFLICSTTAVADDVPLTCAGTAPDWTLTVTGDSAEFDYLYSSDLTLMLTTQAAGGDWPRALTLIGRGDSAILMIEPQACETGALSARILTQRGETPVLLTGCCEGPTP